MSRSRKKSPIHTDGSPGTTKESKRYANKKVRNTEDLPQHGGYKKAFESYEIHDFVIRYPWEEVKQEWESGDEYYRDKYSTLQELRRHWEKYYYSK